MGEALVIGVEVTQRHMCHQCPPQTRWWLRKAESLGHTDSSRHFNRVENIPSRWLSWAKSLPSSWNFRAAQLISASFRCFYSTPNLISKKPFQHQIMEPLSSNFNKFLKKKKNSSTVVTKNVMGLQSNFFFFLKSNTGSF